jgi:glutathione S-transferase
MSVQIATFVAQLKILDGHIAERDWFALDRFTIADIALGSIVKRCLEFPIERPPYPELTRWQAAIDARPAFARGDRHQAQRAEPGRMMESV